MDKHPPENPPVYPSWCLNCIKAVVPGPGAQHPDRTLDSYVCQPFSITPFISLELQYMLPFNLEMSWVDVYMHMSTCAL